MAASRPTQSERRERTRSKLLKAAREEFGQRGYNGASIDEIAAKAGLSKGAVYYNFENKDDLFLALLDERAAERIRSIQAVFASSSASDAEVGARVQIAAGEALETLRQSREWRVLFLEFVVHAARNPDFGAEAAKRFERVRAAIADVVSTQAAGLGVTLPLPAGQLGVAINALGNGLALEMLITPDAIPEELFGELLNYLFVGMTAGAG